MTRREYVFPHIVVLPGQTHATVPSKGLCQTRCHTINVKAKKKLSHTAIEVFAGPGKEDRLMKGSYLQLREQEKQRRTENPSTPDINPDLYPSFSS